ncbi:MAG: thermonuclease family protein [Planctomycetes bacterium]|nr:thermonuclease family protein [Planctomycetota bacterium]
MGNGLLFHGPRRRVWRAAALLLGAAAGVGGCFGPEVLPDRGEPITRGYTVAEVLTGDTLLLEDGEKLRYIGVRALRPGEPYFERALEVQRRNLEGKEIEVVFERRYRDPEGELTGWVFSPVTNAPNYEGFGRENLGIPPDQKMFVNAAIVKNGYGVLEYRIETEQRKYVKMLEEADAYARRNRAGIHGAGDKSERPAVITVP